MFCSEICMQKALNEFHQFQCNIDAELNIQRNVLTMIVKCNSLFDGNRNEMEKFMASNMKKLITPFDFDISISSRSSERNIMLTQLCANNTVNWVDSIWNIYKLYHY